MTQKNAICTACGAQLSLDGLSRTVTCSFCQTTILTKQAIGLSMMAIDHTEDILNLRENLALAVEHNNIEEILRISQKLKDLMPTDVTANYFFAYAKKVKNQSSFLEVFLTSEFEGTDADYQVVVNHLIQRSDLRDKIITEKYIEKVMPAMLQKFQSNYERRYHQEDQYANIPREVFICHSSKQSDIAENIVKTVEDEEYYAWISTRNLRPQDSENYWDNIEQAIIHSQVVLVVSSRESMISKDVIREIEIAKKHGKSFIEFKVDDTPHTMFFKHAFDGLKWIEGNKDINHGFKQLKQRLFDLLKKEVFTPTIPKSIPHRKRRSIMKFVMLLILILGSASVYGYSQGLFDQWLNASPTIEGVEDIVVDLGTAFNPLEGVYAMDSNDGDLTTHIDIEGTVNIDVAGVYTLIYTVTNQLGKTTSIARTITVVNQALSNTALPWLFGVNDASIALDEDFDNLQGITAWDSIDGNITHQIQVTGTVNRAVAGMYVITYSVMNSRGHRIVETRNVYVTGILEIENASHFLTGNFAGWGEAIGNENYKMEAIALNDARVASIRRDLSGATALYILEVTFPAVEAGWTLNYKIDGVNRVFDGNLSFKVVRTSSTDEGIPLWWGQSPESGKFNNLTPNMIYVPPFTEENIDGAGAWNDNPVVLEAGTYYIIFAEIGSARYVGAILKDTNLLK